MIYDIFDFRMFHKGTVDAPSDAAAMEHAKTQMRVTSPMVQRRLSQAEQRQRHYDEEVQIWNRYNRKW